MNTKTKHLLFLFILLFTLTSSNGSDLLLSLLVMFAQLVNFIGFGIIGIIYSIISLKKASAIKTGKILITIFSIASIISMFLLVVLKADNGYIIVTTLVELVMAGLSFLFLSKAKKNISSEEVKSKNDMETI